MDETSLISSAEQQLKQFGEFFDHYDHQLASLLQKTKTLNLQAVSNDVVDPIIKIDYSTDQEQVTVLRLLESDRLLNKTLLTFAYLCAEVESLVSDAYRMQMKFLFIDEDICLESESNKPADNDKQKNERILLKMSDSIEFLCNMQFLLQRCIIVGNNMLHQFGAFLDFEDFTLEFKLFNVFDYFAELLHQILIFDEILLNSNFTQNWSIYKKTIDVIAENCDTMALCSTAEINGLRSCLQEIELLFSGEIFRNFLDSIFSLKDKISAKSLGQLTQQFNEYMKQNLNTIDNFQGGDLNDFNETKLLVRLNAFCVVFHDFCGQIDAKLVKHLLELNIKYQGIVLIGNIVWSPTPFLRKYAETLMKTHEKLLQSADRHWHNFLQTRTQTLQRDCRSYCNQISIWSLNVHKQLNNGAAFELKVNKFKEFAATLILGFRYAGQISYICKAIINTHTLLQVPMTKQSLLSICKLIEMLKVIQSTFHKHTATIAKVLQCILQYFQYKILHLLALSKQKVTSTKMQERNVDALASIKIAEKCMSGPSTKNRILIAKLAINAIHANNRILSGDQCEKFNLLIERMEILTDFQQHMKKVCDTSFLYWHQSILSTYLNQVVDRKIDFNSFQYLIKASNDCNEILKILQLGDLTLSELLQKSHFENMRNIIISNLCAQIETFLRLEVHSSLQLDKMKPFDESINDYRDLINLCPIQINGHYVILKDHVENYLSAMFYNLTTISLHDWKTYEEMRHFANHRLMLNPVDDYLPNQTLEQGIDILEIMRNIHIFVSKYVYNMNSQVFVEQKSASKHLDSIGIRHVANSLRTHGTGVINTTVNFTYQFLRQKFYTFSQFLYDEQIKSRLMKELRSYGERKPSESFPLYPFDRADAFNKDIRKLGLSNDNQTYMDLFRKVITQVGNAMGYIRLVRSGNIHANYSASLYLPKFDENLQFVEICKNNLQLHDATITAAENFEANIKNLVRSFSDSTDYFKLLVDAFLPFFQNPHNMHLKNFFLIVPPLTLNYIEYMLNVKEKISKKDRQETVLFDDGFAIGLAYILKLLNQIDDFNALQWFATVRERFEAERRKILDMLTEITTQTSNPIQKTENEKLQQTLTLTERRINANQMEYNLLYYNMSSAKIFFQ